MEKAPSESVRVLRLEPPFVNTSSTPGIGHVPQRTSFGRFGKQLDAGAGGHT